MQTTTSFKPGNAPDLLSGILSVEVKKRGQDYRARPPVLSEPAGHALQDA